MKRYLPVAALPTLVFAAQASGLAGPPTADVPSERIATDAEIARHCSTCHGVPRADDAPRHMWRPRIEEMAQRSLLGTGLREGAETSLWQQDLAPLIRAFESKAPGVLPAPTPWPETRSEVIFERHSLKPAGAAPVPMISSVRFFDLDGVDGLEVVACDMGHGLVLLGHPTRPAEGLHEIARVPNPARAEMVDLDGDGRRDLLVADLGAFLPEDHAKGAVVWLRQTVPLVFEKRVLVEGLPRVADVRAADVDGDGDLDLVVAAFGWQTTGRLSTFLNETADWSAPRFEESALDPRAGFVRGVPTDIDRDGRTDVVGLVGQQHEEVVAYMGSGDRGHGLQTLFQAPSPAWGSTDASVADLDSDGDLDVLLANGASLDDFTVRPYHGIRWLENRGRAAFERHDVVAMPGAHGARAADLDGDGDLDVAACAFLPAARHPAFSGDTPNDLSDRAALTAVGWIERLEDGSMRPHALERGRTIHPTLDAADYDGDGDVDLVVGNFVGFTFARTDTGFTSDVWVEVWENKGADGDESAK